MRRTNRLSILWLVLALLLVIGCEPGAVPTGRFVVEDSAGLTVTRNEAPRLPGLVLVDPEPIMVIPAEFDAPEHLLVFPDYAAHLSNGRVVVGDRGTNELFFFSAQGAFLGALGGEGQGPGEFQRLFGAFRCQDDRLVIVELSRLSIVHGRSMEFEGNVQMAGHLAATRAPIAGVRSDCSAALVANPNVPPVRARNRAFDASVSLYWADFATGARDSVGTFPATELYPWETGGRTVPVRAPYGRNAVWAVHPAGIVFASARDASYRLLGADGRVLQIVRWAAPASLLTDEEWDYFEVSRDNFVREHPEEAAFQPPRGYLPRPERKPPYADVKIDDTGRIWIQTYDRYSVYGPVSSPRWWLFTSDGEWLAEVQMPDGLEVRAIGEATVIGVVRDDLDLAQVQVHQLNLPTTEPLE